MHQRANSKARGETYKFSTTSLLVSVGGVKISRYQFVLGMTLPNYCTYLGKLNLGN
jgi:hypothetical protein